MSGDQIALVIELAVSAISLDRRPIGLTFEVVVIFQLVAVCRIFVAGRYMEGARTLSIGSVRFSAFAFKFHPFFGSVFQLVETALTVGATVAIDA